MSKSDIFAPLELRETPKYVERTYAYGSATIVERVSHSELGEDFEVLENLFFITPGGRKLSALTVAGIDGLRIAIERNDVSDKHAKFAYYYNAKVIGSPRSIFAPRAYRKSGVARKGNNDHALWSLPGCWLALLHEMGHAHIAHCDPIRHRRDTKYAERMDAIFDAIIAGDAMVEIDHDRYIAYTIRAERDAWAWALRTLRRYRRIGIDFEPELDTSAKLEGYVHSKLATYLIRMLIMMGEDEDLESYVSGLNKTLRGVPSNLKHNNELLFAGR